MPNHLITFRKLFRDISANEEEILAVVMEYRDYKEGNYLFKADKINMSPTDREAMYNHYSDQLPVGYLAEPDDIAQAYLYLIQQKYSTGQIVITDGDMC